MENTNSILKSVIGYFMLFWVLSGIGFILSPYLPITLILPISIVAIVLIISLIFIHNKVYRRIVYFAYSIFSGVLLYYTIQRASKYLSEELLFGLILGTVTLFIIMGCVGYFVKRDLNSWGKYLFGFILVLFLISIIAIFFNPPNMFYLILSGVFILYAVLSTVYEFNLISQGYISEDEAMEMGFNIYISFIILLKSIINFVISLKDEFDL